MLKIKIKIIPDDAATETHEFESSTDAIDFLMERFTVEENDPRPVCEKAKGTIFEGIREGTVVTRPPVGLGNDL